METLLKILAELRPDVDFEENKELLTAASWIPSILFLW